MADLRGWPHSIAGEAYKLFIILLSLLALFAVSLDPGGFRGLPPADAVFFFAAIAAAEALPVFLPQRNTSVSISFAMILAAVAVLGTGPGIALAAVATISKAELAAPNRPWSFIFNRAQLALSAALAGFVLHGVLRGASVASGIGVAAFFLAGIAYWVVNLSAVTLVVLLKEGLSPRTAWLGNFLWPAANYLALTPIAYLMTLVHLNIGWPGLLFFFLPLLIARHSFRQYFEMRESYIATVTSLVAALDARDHYTAGHSQRVSELSVQLGRKLGLSPETLEQLRYAALLHDVGKIGIPDAILNKAGRYEDWEYEIMKKHAEIGGELLRDVKFLREGSCWVAAHHERWDGSGYPRGLRGEQIPLGARIIAVADSYDAMVSGRAYRPGFPVEKARQEIIAKQNILYDPRVVAAFAEIMGEHAGRATAWQVPQPAPRRDA